MKFAQRIFRVKKLLKTPYHFFSIVPGGDIMVILERTNGYRFSFRSDNILNCLKEAENYVDNEIEMGTIVEKTSKKKK
jgi:exopolysaccharide biosynthesis predicted pyruvyltransferase EpsI